MASASNPDLLHWLRGGGFSVVSLLMYGSASCVRPSRTPSSAEPSPCSFRKKHLPRRSCTSFACNKRCGCSARITPDASIIASLHDSGPIHTGCVRRCIPVRVNGHWAPNGLQSGGSQREVWFGMDAPRVVPHVRDKRQASRYSDTTRDGTNVNQA